MKASKKSTAPREPRSRLLAFDPTPAGLVTAPLRTSYKYLWKRLREEHFQQGDFSCDTCKVIESKAPLIHAHEVYLFPDSQRVELERISFICTRCHDAMHFDRTRRRCQEPYRQTLIEHYCRVNGGIIESEFWQDFEDTFEVMLAIRKSYGGPGATPQIGYGPFQVRVDDILKRRAARASGVRKSKEVVQWFDND